MSKLVADAPLWYLLIIIFAALLIVVGIILPPVGKIDNSILVGIGELAGMAAVGLLPTIVKASKK